MGKWGKPVSEWEKRHLCMIHMRHKELCPDAIKTRSHNNHKEKLEPGGQRMPKQRLPAFGPRQKMEGCKSQIQDAICQMECCTLDVDVELMPRGTVSIY